VSAEQGKAVEKAYARLKAHDAELYRKCIQYGEGVTLKHGLGHRAAADLEIATVFAVAEAIGVWP